MPFHSDLVFCRFILLAKDIFWDWLYQHRQLPNAMVWKDYQRSAKIHIQSKGNLRQTPLNTLIHKKRNRGFVGVTFNSSPEFGFKDWSSSKYQNPIPWSNNWNWISKERKHFCLFSFQNLLINLIDLWNFAAILTLWKDLL